MKNRPELPIVEFPDQVSWRQWLQSNHATSAGAWVKLAKKGSGVSTIDHPQALEEALCFGWIDGQSRRHDERFYLIRFTPRRPRSSWSQLNRARATQLIADGRMAPAGLAEVEAAQADGRWENAYPPQSQAAVPQDFEHSLSANPTARQFFDTLSGSRRYAFLYRLHQVTDPAKRGQTIERYVELLAAGKTLQE